MIFVVLVFILVSELCFAAVVPPPWADPKINPCALKPRGWQMLFWPPDGQCYKIFKMGHPCAPTMELTPGKAGSGIPAECRCPPGTIRPENAKTCYSIFTRGPCLYGEYFSPNASKISSMPRIGSCVKSPECPDRTQLFWPVDGKCYRKMSRGPCPLGKLLIFGSDGIANCTCDGDGEHAWEEDGRCYEHYARGPCARGLVFLPGGRCGCSPDLPHYDAATKSCHEIGSIGPCKSGHRFTLSNTSKRGKCQCKPDYEPWSDGSCYRLYTKGPCPSNELFASPSRCVPLPCRKSRLYFAEEKKCFKIGSQGPCKAHEVVIFDFEARPSIDGIAYNGVCGCSNALSIDSPDSCGTKKMADSDCQQSPGMVDVDNMCYMLYTKGPCEDGQWLIPSHDITNDRKGECVCKPGFTKHSDSGIKENSSKDELCLPPTVSLARYLNEKYNKGR